MNIDIALKTLNLNNYTKYNIYKLNKQELRKAYHKKALSNHPDKNINNFYNDDEFKNIFSAYEFLLNIINNEDCNNDINNHKHDSKYYEFDYLLNNFINIFQSNNYNNYNIEDLNNNYIEYINNLLEKFLKNKNISFDILLEIYNIIELLNNNKLNNIKNIIKNTLSNYKLFILTPNIESILNSEIYKLTIDNNIIYVPLWHKQLTYENYIINIEYIKDNNITIDDNNNIHYEYYNTFDNLIMLLNNNSNLCINTLNISIPIYELKIKKHQIYKIKNQGLPKINYYNIFDNSIKCDIYIYINLK